MSELFHAILFRPIFNLLVFLYDVIPGGDIGFAIIVLTVLIKLALWPLMNQSLKSQKALQELQPKIDVIKKDFKDDREGQAKALMQLYQAEKVNPLASCLPLLIQIPILIALYQVLLAGFGSENLNALYSFVSNPGEIHHVFLGLVDLSQKSIPLAVLAGVFQFWQTRMLITNNPPKQVEGKPGSQDESMLAAMNKSMLTVMPVMTVLIGATLPGGLTLYWVTVNIVSIIQQRMVFHHKTVVAKT